MLHAWQQLALSEDESAIQVGHATSHLAGQVMTSALERWSLTGKLSLPSARRAAGG